MPDGETGHAQKIAVFEVAMKAEGLAVLGVETEGQKTVVKLLITFDNDPHATTIPSRFQTATLVREPHSEWVGVPASAGWNPRFRLKWDSSSTSTILSVEVPVSSSLRDWEAGRSGPPTDRLGRRFGLGVYDGHGGGRNETRTSADVL